MNAINGALKSKTMWLSFATILLGNLAAPVQAIVVAHPGLATTVLGAVFGVLRMFTSQSLAEKGGTPSA